jgi:hypothetical protein
VSVRLEWKWEVLRVRVNFALPFLLACAAITPACAQASEPAVIPTPLVYRNTQYGFCFRLPADWKGYTLIWEKWEGSPLDNTTTRKPIEGPNLRIRHPKWTQDDPHEDIPIMIFTVAQWELAETDEYSFSAAPIGPGEIARNSRYVFALPARWSFDEATGVQEVVQLIQQHSLQAPCGKSQAKPAE